MAGSSTVRSGCGTRPPAKQTPRGATSSGTTALAFSPGMARPWPRAAMVRSGCGTRPPASRHPLGATSSGTTALVYSPDGKTLATSSGYGTTRLWDVSACVAVGKPYRHALPPSGRDRLGGV